MADQNISELPAMTKVETPVEREVTNKGLSSIKIFWVWRTVSHTQQAHNLNIGVALVTQLRKCVIKIVLFKGGHLMW